MTAPTAAASVVAAIDVGGTRIKAALVRQDFQVVAATTSATPPDIADDIAGVVDGVVGDLFAAAAAADREVPRSALVGCAVAAPGVVDAAAGVGIRSVNLGWADLPIRDLVAARSGVPVWLGHDVRAGLLAEARLGAASHDRQVMFVPLGTGIAGALLLDGRVVEAGGRAGELGHVVVDPDGDLCPCGQHGCLETLSSAAAIERRYRGSGGAALSAEQIAQLVRQDDHLATTVWVRAVQALGAAITIALTLTGIELVVIGGGLSLSGDILFDPLRADVAARLTFQPQPRIVPAALGDRAGCLGAACLAWDALGADLS